MIHFTETRPLNVFARYSSNNLLLGSGLLSVLGMYVIFLIPQQLFITVTQVIHTAGSARCSSAKSAKLCITVCIVWHGYTFSVIYEIPTELAHGWIYNSQGTRLFALICHPIPEH